MARCRHTKALYRTWLLAPGAALGFASRRRSNSLNHGVVPPASDLHVWWKCKEIVPTTFLDWHWLCSFWMRCLNCVDQVDLFIIVKEIALADEPNLPTTSHVLNAQVS